MALSLTRYASTPIRCDHVASVRFSEAFVADAGEAIPNASTRTRTAGAVPRSAGRILGFAACLVVAAVIVAVLVALLVVVVQTLLIAGLVVGLLVLGLLLDVFGGSG